MNKKTLVLGGSTKPSRYSFKAINLLQSKGHDVVSIGRSIEQVGKTTILDQKRRFKDIDTVSIYLRDDWQEEYKNYIITLRPKRVIFNPGAENPKLSSFFNQMGIETENACTLVLLNIGNY